MHGLKRHLLVADICLEQIGRAQICRLAHAVPALWQVAMIMEADRRVTSLLLIECLIATVDPPDDRVLVQVAWAGGLMQEHRVGRAVLG